MSNKLPDPRSARTAALLRAALMDLVALHGFDSVSVVALCKTAGVNRATFYLHYRDKFELLEDCLLGFFDAVASPLADTPPPDVASQLPDLFRAAAVTCFDRRAFILAILEHGRFPALHAVFTRRMSWEVGRLMDQLEKEGHAASGPDREHQTVFLSSAFFGSLLYWIKEGRPEHLDGFCRDMAAYTMALLRA